MKGGQLNGNAFVSTERAKAYIEARRPQNAKPHRIPADAGLVSSVREDEFHGLPLVTVYTGTLEILWPDALKFCTLAREQGVAVDCRERAGINLVFPVYPIPEAETAQQEIIRIIGQVSHLI